MADNWEQKELSDEFQDKLKNLLHKDLSVGDWKAILNKIGSMANYQAMGS
tara:strand:- start:279 stop:428 length:150 start_codon:yes stop_codon:yes gene_type:complete